MKKTVANKLRLNRETLLLAQGGETSALPERGPTNCDCYYSIRWLEQQMEKGVAIPAR